MTLTHPARTKGELIKDFRTSGILDAARRVIAESGWSDASMERIAQEAGVSKGTLYLYFRNKETLLVGAFEHAFTELMQRTREATRSVRGARARIRAIVRAGIEHARENQGFLHALQAHPQLGPEGVSLLTSLVTEQIEQYIRFVAQLIERGVRDQEFRPIDGRLAARFLFEVLRGVVIERVQSPTSPSVQEDVNHTVDFFFHGISTGE